MKAIVLSYDKHIQIVDLVLHSYQSLWPTNPFIFRVPYNNVFPSHLKKKYGDKIELIKTRREIKYTMDALLKNIPDEEWVWWCSDDRYLEKIDEKRANKICYFVKNLKDPKMGGILMVNQVFKRQFVLLDGAMVDDRCINEWIRVSNGGRFIRFVNKWNPRAKGSKFIRRMTYRGFYQHGFIKTRLLKRVFLSEEYPDDYKLTDQNTVCKTLGLGPNPAKRTKSNERMYYAKKTVGVWKESIRNGKLIQICRDAMLRYGLPLPELEVRPNLKEKAKRELFLSDGSV